MNTKRKTLSIPDFRKAAANLALVAALGTFAGPAHALPAFPGAEGWGSDTPAGRGGKVYVVTNLDASGPGSLRDGILMKEPRIIVFRVSGVIPLKVAAKDLVEANSFLTIAGQTSPGGITITEPSGDYSWHSYGINVNNFVWRHLRFRTEHANDGVQFGPSHDFVLDHCDFSGGEDETTDMFYATRFTMQWCTIANSETPTSKGTIVAGQGDHLTFHHNIWAHHQERTPGIFWDQVPPDNGLVDIRNNIMYDINGYSTIITGTGNVNIVNNMWKMGPNTKAAHIAWTPYFNQPLKVYDSGNCFHETDGSAFGCDSLLEKRYGPANRVSTSWPTPAVTTTSVAQAYDDLLRFAGAVPKDSMNRRVERDVRTGTGASYIIGDPKITSGPPPAADADLDGMPDFWETAMKLNPNSAADAVGDADGDGYTNVEEYLNDLALARVCRDYYNSVNPVPADWTNHDPSCAKPLPVEGNRDGKRQSAVPGFFLSKAPHIGAGPLPASLTRGAGGIQVLTSTGRVTASSQDAPGLRWQGAVSPAPGTYIIRWSDGHGRQATRKWVVPR